MPAGAPHSNAHPAPVRVTTLNEATTVGGIPPARRGRSTALAGLLIAMAGTAAIWAAFAGQPPNIDGCAALDQETDQTACVSEAAMHTLANEGEAAAVTLIIDASRRIPAVGTGCHGIHHSLGEQAATTRTATGLPERVPYTCFGGYWHGFLTERGMQLTLTQYVTEVAHLCDVTAPLEPIVDFDCNHGVGHGLGMMAGTTLPEAFQACSAAVDPRGAKWCASGVASAYADRANRGHGTPVGPEATYPQVRATCTSISAPYDQYCWERVAGMAVVAGIGPKDFITTCTQADTGTNGRQCARGIGLLGDLADTPETARVAAGICALVPLDLERGCIGGYLWRNAPLEAMSGQPTLLCDYVGPELAQWCHTEQQTLVSAEIGPVSQAQPPTARETTIRPAGRPSSP